MAASGIKGVAETIAQLQRIEPALDKSMAAAIVRPAQAAAAALAGAAPSQPLSRMPSYPVTAAVDGGKAGVTNGQKYLVRVALTGGGFTVSSDIARTSVNSMVPNLNRKYGTASRWVWPTVERFRPQMEAAADKAAKDVERKTTAQMKG